MLLAFLFLFLPSINPVFAPNFSLDFVFVLSSSSSSCLPLCSPQLPPHFFFSFVIIIYLLVNISFFTTLCISLLFDSLFHFIKYFNSFLILSIFLNCFVLYSFRFICISASLFKLCLYNFKYLSILIVFFYATHCSSAIYFVLEVVDVFY